MSLALLLALSSSAVIVVGKPTNVLRLVRVLCIDFLSLKSIDLSNRGDKKFYIKTTY